MHIILLLVLLSLILNLGACATPEYNWSNYYEHSSRYVVDRNLARYQQELQKIIDSTKDKKLIPPGLLAENAVLLLKLEKPDEARHYFDLEKQHWPETEFTLDEVLFNLK